MKDVKVSDYSFRIMIKDLEDSHPRDLLGRDHTYTLNINAVDADERPVVGIQYTIKANKADALVHKVTTSIDENATYISSDKGTDFSISGSPALSAEDFPLMEYDFTVTCTAVPDSVSGNRTFKIGRLMKWGRPLISVAGGSAQAVFKTKTEWFGDHKPGAMWNWGETIEQCTLDIPALEISATTPTQRNADGSVACDNLVELSKFASAAKANVLLNGGLSKNGYTAVMAHVEELELYYVKSVEFEAPSAIIDVETQVTCVLFGLNGKPRSNGLVNWSADTGDILDPETSTDANGVATTRYRAKESGEAKVTATAAHPYISGVSPTTPTGPLEIASKNASGTEYVVGHSPAINFSVMLAVKGHVPPRTKVQWSVAGDPPKESESDNTGKAVITFDFKAGEHTVSAKLSNGLWVTFSVKAFDVVIAKREPPGSIDFVIAHSDPIVFKAWLTADNKPLANKKVNWLVDNANKGIVTSDSQGMVTHTEAFAAEGDHSVIVEVHNSGQRQTFPVKAYNMVIADHAPKASKYVLGMSKKIQFSATIKAGGKLISGVNVLWLKDGAASGDSNTQAPGVAYIEKDFTTKGTHTVTAKITKTPSQTATYTVEAYEVAIERQEPTAAVDYIIGHTPELTFAVWLAAAGGAQANAQVEWGVDGEKQKDTESDSAGKASYSAKGFGVTGERKVTAKVVLSGHLVEFPFNVYRVGITEPSVSNPEYIIKHSADVEFSAVLKAGPRTLSGVEVEWTVGGTTVKNKSDGNGKVTFKKGFDTPGSHTVTLKEPKSEASKIFTVNASQVEITEPYISDPEYIINHSPDVEFSAVLKAGTRKLSGIEVELTVGGTTVKSKSDGNGKVTFKKGFDTPGNHTVTLKEPKSGKSQNFSVVVDTWVFTTKIVGNPLAFDALSPDLLSRTTRYQISVTVSDSAGKPVRGAKYSLTNPGPAYSSIGLAIQDLNKEVVSGDAPHLFEISAEPWDKPESFTFRLVYAGINVGEKTYRLGWIFNLGPALLWLSRLVTVTYPPLVLDRYYTGEAIELEAITAWINTTINFEMRAFLPDEYLLPCAFGEVSEDVRVGSLLSVGRSIGLGGYVVLNPGSTLLLAPGLSEFEERASLSDAEYKLLSEAGRVIYDEHLLALSRRLKE
ncbi:Ig-like domain-containing protein [Pseudomonas sp. RC10]|uniref:Ig-like domain-containing protein n=1 Tax=Pseudomonas bambusae TaxID=3139142 RepID=UPI00313A27E9